MNVLEYLKKLIGKNQRKGVKISDRFRALESRISSLESSLGDIKNQLTILVGSVNNIRNQLNNIPSRIQQVEEMQQVSQQDIKGIRKEISSLRKEVESLEEYLKNLKKKVEDLEKRVRLCDELFKRKEEYDKLKKEYDRLTSELKKIIDELKKKSVITKSIGKREKLKEYSLKLGENVLCSLYVGKPVGDPLFLELAHGHDLEGISYQVTKELVSESLMEEWGEVRINNGQKQRIHFKLYFVKEKGHVIGCYLGSANFTESGLSRNIELLLEVRDEHLIEMLYGFFKKRLYLTRKGVNHKLMGSLLELIDALEEKGVLVKDPELYEENRIYEKVLDLIKNSKNEVILVSPYISQEIIEKLLKHIFTKGDSHVNVRIITGYFGNKIHYDTYEFLCSLLEKMKRGNLHNIEIWLLPNLHMKALITDNGAIIGSSNMTSTGILDYFNLAELCVMINDIESLGIMKKALLDLQNIFRNELQLCRSPEELEAVLKEYQPSSISEVERPERKRPPAIQGYNIRIRVKETGEVVYEKENLKVLRYIHIKQLLETTLRKRLSTSSRVGLRIEIEIIIGERLSEEEMAGIREKVEYVTDKMEKIVHDIALQLGLKVQILKL